MEIVWLDMCHICIEFSTRDCLADVPIVSDMLMIAYTARALTDFYSKVHCLA